MRKLKLIIALFLLIGSSSLNAQTLNDFMMMWHFTDATGTANYGISHEICVGESVYIKNISIYNAPDCTGSNGIPIGNNLTTGTYGFMNTQGGGTMHFIPVGYSSGSIPAADWQYGDVIEIQVNVSMTAGPLNFKVQHWGPGVTPACVTARYRSGYLNAYTPQQVTANASPIQVCSGEQVTLTASGSGNYQWSNGQSGTPVYDNPTATTTYTVNATDGNGCSSSDQIEVQVLNKPKLNLNNHYLCQNDPFPTLDAGPGGAQYEWRMNTPFGPIVGTSQTYTPTAFGTYCCVKTGLNGCSSTDCSIVDEDARLSESSDFNLSLSPGSGNNLNVSATMAPLPSGYSFFWQVDELDPNTNAVISSTVNPPLWWNYPTYLTFPGYTFLKNHKYRITRAIWSDDGCLQWKQSSYEFMFESKRKRAVYPIGNVDTGINIEEAKRTTKANADKVVTFDVYPNPSTGVFQISGEDEIESLQVVDITGKEVLVDTPNSTTTSFDLSTFGKGTYFVRLTTEGKVQTEMIQVQ
ncbi:MAG: T9SS type A sorting domain-containing protein [Fluviicola sp.]